MDRKKIEVKYNLLKKRIDKIKEHFDFKPGIHGLTPLQNDKIKGFLLLCHAEIEDYIEGLALLLLDDAYDKWKKNHHANYNLASLFIDAERIEKNESVQTRSEHIISLYRQEVEKNNHGIKSHNIKSMFYPLGYLNDDFDSAFIGTLNSFGSDRGKVAHTTGRTTVVYDKKTEFDRIDYIVSGLHDFQEVLINKANS